MLNKLELEVVVLNQLLGLISNFVNWTIFIKTTRRQGVELKFQSNDTRKYFYIHLCDFLMSISSRNNGELPFGLPQIEKSNLLFGPTILHFIPLVCKEPVLLKDAHVLLERAERTFKWLEDDFETDEICFPSLDTSTTLTFRRLDYVKICGNISKHNLLHLSWCRKLLERALCIKTRKQYSDYQMYMAMNDFVKYFSHYPPPTFFHSNQIAELLNNLTWAIHCCVGLLHSKSIRTEEFIDGFVRYDYIIPNGLCNPIAQDMFRSLMNHVRRRPLIHLFKIQEYLWKEY